MRSCRGAAGAAVCAPAVGGAMRDVAIRRHQAATLTLLPSLPTCAEVNAARPPWAGNGGKGKGKEKNSCGAIPGGEPGSCECWVGGSVSKKLGWAAAHAASWKDASATVTTRSGRRVL